MVVTATGGERLSRYLSEHGPDDRVIEMGGPWSELGPQTASLPHSPSCITKDRDTYADIAPELQAAFDWIDAHVDEAIADLQTLRPADQRQRPEYRA